MRRWVCHEVMEQGRAVVDRVEEVLAVLVVVVGAAWADMRQAPGGIAYAPHAARGLSMSAAYRAAI